MDTDELCVVALLPLERLEDLGDNELVRLHDQPSVGFYRNDGLGRFGPGDVTAPVITLVGPERVALKVGESFIDPGVTASDDIEGDVSGRVEASGSVDTAVVGTYTVVYQVADRSGNTAAPVQRMVDVQAASGTSGGGGGVMSPVTPTSPAVKVN